MKLIFDTGSDWLMIAGNDCDSCGVENKRYNPAESTFFNERSSTKENRIFGTIFHLKGKQVSDMVCLQKFTVCVQPFTWFQITE